MTTVNLVTFGKAERAHQRYVTQKSTRELLLAWFRAEVAELPIAEQGACAAYTDEMFMSNTQRFEAKARGMYAVRNAAIKKEVTAQQA